MSKKKSESEEVIDYAALAEQLAAENVALTDNLQRERADAMNASRHHQAQMSSIKTMVKSQVLKDLLPALDNLERSLKYPPKTDEGEPRTKNQELLEDYIKGISGVVKQFEKTLADLGVERIKTVGEPFDPNLHEAVSTEGEGLTEIVSEELQAGYKIGEDIIRHAMVRVTAR